MKTYTLDELAQHTGKVRPHLVRYWKQEKPIDGHVIYMDATGEEKCWYLVPLDQHEAGEIVVDGVTYSREEIEAGAHRSAGADYPELTCPNCGATEPDMDGFGLVACPRDPSCYCTHPARDDGECTICGDVEGKEDPTRTLEIAALADVAGLTNGKDELRAEAIRIVKEKDLSDWPERDKDGRELARWAVSQARVNLGAGRDPDDTGDAPLAEITKDWLTSIEGIGSTGADKLLEQLAEDGISSFAELAAITDLTSLPSIGKKNGANLRAALEVKAGCPDKSDAKNELFSHIKQRLSDLIDDEDDLERAIEIAEERVDAGEYDGALTRDGIDLEAVARTGAEYCKALAVKERLGLDQPTEDSAYPEFVYGLDPDDIATAKAAVDTYRADGEYPADLTGRMHQDARRVFAAWVESLKSTDIEIRCPWCDGLWDSIPAGVAEGGRAECEADGEEDRGDCGKLFWIEATADGYEVRKTRPAEVVEPKKGPICGACSEVIVGDADKLETEEDGKRHIRFFHRYPEDCSANDTGITITGQTDVTEEVSELVPDGGEAAITVDAQPKQAAREVKAPKPKRNPFGTRPKAGKRANPFAKKRKKPAPRTGLVPQDERIHPALIDCRSIGRADHGTDAWHELRTKGIGSSDAGALLGLSPHATAVDVWKTKIGEDTDNKTWLEPYGDFGSWFEPYLRQWCEGQHGIEIIDGAELGTLQSARWKHALAHIDGLDVTNGVVEEYKTTTEKWKEIPANYEAQCQEQMLVCGVREVRLRQFVCPIPRAHVPSLLEEMRGLNPINPDAADQVLADWLLDNGEVHTWIVERDERYLERMLTRFKKFWGFVEMGVEPTEADPEGTVDLTDEPEVYAACVEYARLNNLFEAQAMKFLEAEGIEPSKRGSVSGTAEKALKAAKKKVRKAIDKAIALSCDADDRPKRVDIGDHSATYVDRGTHAYWNIYTGENDAVDF